MLLISHYNHLQQVEGLNVYDSVMQRLARPSEPDPDDGFVFCSGIDSSGSGR